MHADLGYSKKQPILRVDDLELEQGTLCVIVGPNMSGKTTLCKTLAGILPPIGAEKFELPPTDPVLVWQSRELFPVSLEENLHLVSRDARLVAQLLQDFGLQAEAKTKASRLSGGAAQKAAICRALAVQGVTAIIFDEPSKEIDASSVDDVARQILRVHGGGKGKTTIVVTHDERLLSLLSVAGPRFYLIESGRLLGPMSDTDVLVKPTTVYAAELAGYRNVFADATNGAYQFPRHLTHLKRGTTRHVLIVPEGAARVTVESQRESLDVEFIGREIRGRGQILARYRWQVGGGEQPCEIVVEVPGDTTYVTGRGYLSIDANRCIRIRV